MQLPDASSTATDVKECAPGPNVLPGGGPAVETLDAADASAPLQHTFSGPAWPKLDRSGERSSRNNHAAANVGADARDFPRTSTSKRQNPFAAGLPQDSRSRSTITDGMPVSVCELQDRLQKGQTPPGLLGMGRGERGDGPGARKQSGAGKCRSRASDRQPSQHKWPMDLASSLVAGMMNSREWQRQALTPTTHVAGTSPRAVARSTLPGMKRGRNQQRRPLPATRHPRSASPRTVALGVVPGIPHGRSQQRRNLSPTTHARGASPSAAASSILPCIVQRCNHQKQHPPATTHSRGADPEAAAVIRQRPYQLQQGPGMPSSSTHGQSSLARVVEDTNAAAAALMAAVEHAPPADTGILLAQAALAGPGFSTQGGVSQPGDITHLGIRQPGVMHPGISQQGGVAQQQQQARLISSSIRLCGQ
ncbi:hypothetical protein WJX84_006102 [Apatococcus fuscideae]|uniref:Uncharacterized protein n=1 Tax=Apatococcus fuscideae TaxID=2026836 RepID=A0AAW1SYF8_9CHLO